MSGAGGAPTVSLIVVNFNGAASMQRCIESLVDSGPIATEVIVVDNASDDSSPALLRELAGRHPSFHVIRNDRNLGYAGAVNRVLSLCRGRYLAVLNMDIVAEPGWLAPLVAHLDAHPETGAACPLITLMDGRTVNAIGQDLHVTGLGFNRGLGEARTNAGGQALRTAGLHGAAFLVRRDLLAAIGGMDEDGFLYHEDVHLSWMIRLQGYDIACVPGGTVRHDYFLSMHPEKLFLLERNRWRLLLSVLKPRTLLLLSPVLLATELMAWAFAALRGRAFVIAKARSCAAVLRGRAGIAVARRRIASRRQAGDLELLRSLQFGYPWRQFCALANERGPPRRAFSGDRHRPAGH
jgi:GT2 family glycosyltransferase